MKAVQVLIEHGVPEERIIFINLVLIAGGFCSRHVFIRFCRSRLRKGSRLSAGNIPRYVSYVIVTRVTCH
jgi:hypothetical protein